MANIERDFEHKNKNYKITISGDITSGRVGDGSIEYAAKNICFDIVGEDSFYPEDELYQEICEAFEKANEEWYNELIEAKD